MFENTRVLDLTIGRSSVRQRILLLLMDESSGRLHLREVQRRAGTSPGTASRELARLVAAGLIEREAEGNQVYFRASNAPLAAMLRTVLAAMPVQQPQPRPGRLPKAASRSATALTDDASIPALKSMTPSEAADESPATVAPDEPALPTAALDHTAAAGAAAGAAADQPGPTNLGPRVIRPVPAKPKTQADAVVLRIAGRLAESMREIYGESLRGVYLYGTRAAGPAPADADVETVVVLEQVEHYGAELERTSQVCAGLSHEMGIIVSRIFVSETEWNVGPDGDRPAGQTEAVAV